jgi:hypothetical protein
MCLFDNKNNTTDICPTSEKQTYEGGTNMDAAKEK